jgi:hypothetical protein
MNNAKVENAVLATATTRIIYSGEIHCSEYRNLKITAKVILLLVF